MNWKKYLSEKDERKRWDMLQADNRLSYDHVDDWLMSLKYYLENEKEDISLCESCYCMTHTIKDMCGKCKKKKLRVKKKSGKLGE